MEGDHSKIFERLCHWISEMGNSTPFQPTYLEVSRDATYFGKIFHFGINLRQLSTAEV